MANFKIFEVSSNENWSEKSESSRNRGVKLQCSTEEGKQLLVRVIGRFEKMRVQEIRIPLYSKTGFLWRKADGSN